MGGSQAKEVGTWGAARPGLSERGPRDTPAFPLQRLAPGHPPTCPTHRTAPRLRCPKGTPGRGAGQGGRVLLLVAALLPRGCRAWHTGHQLYPSPQLQSGLGFQRGTSEFHLAQWTVVTSSGHALWGPQHQEQEGPMEHPGAHLSADGGEHGEGWDPWRVRAVNSQALPRASSLTPQNPPE